MTGPRWARALAGPTLALALALATPACAQGEGPRPEAGATAPVAAARVAAAEVPTGEEGAGAAAADAEAPRDYLAEVRANFTEENRRYSTHQTWINVGGPLYGVLVDLLILFTGLSARIRDLAHRLSRRRYVRTLVYVGVYGTAGFVLGFPLAYWSGYLVEHQFGLATEGFGKWLGDELKGLAVGVVFFGVVPLVYFAYRAIAASRRWWLYLALGTVPVVVVSMLIQPLVIDPLFNKFEPLRDEALKEKVLALAERADIPGRNVYQVDKSTETRKMNAYVSGFGASQRIVFWDTILDGMEDDEILFVTGHEMGHYVLGHIWKWIVFMSVMSFAFFFLAAQAMNWALARFGGRWGFTELGDIASLPLLGLTLALLFMVARPAMNAWSRTLEHECDVFALELTHLNDAGARAFLALGRDNKSNPEPGPLQKAYLWTHPPLVERVRFMLEYRPWEEGRPNRVFRRPG